MSNLKTIHSPIPGVFYRKASPDQDVYVNEGDAVKAGDTVGLIEVMKSYHEIKAEVDGTIKEFSLEDESMVGVGQEIVTIVVD
jgi:acetyl-CoA carboxylase biotin carboxyl carrier protein